MKDMYDGKNIHGDARLLEKLDSAILSNGGVPQSIYYLSGTSTLNQVLGVQLSKWTITNESGVTPLVVELTNIDDSITTLTIAISSSISYDLIVKDIKLVTASLAFIVSGQEVLLGSEA